MASHSSSSANLYLLGLLRPSKPSHRTRYRFSSNNSCNFGHKELRSTIRVDAIFWRPRVVRIAAMDEDWGNSFSMDSYGDDAASMDSYGDSDAAVAYSFSSSEGEESDGDMMLNPITDVDLPTSRERFHQTDDALSESADELVVLGRTRKKSRIKYGVFINTGLVTFLTVLILLVDCCAWRIVRLPLPPFHLMRPFSTSAILVSCAGYICVPLFRRLKMKTFIRRWPARHSSKKGTPTMGGLFLLPIGIFVAQVIVGFSSIEVSAAALATVAFAAIGLVNDVFSLTKSRKTGVVSWIRILLEAAVGIWFSVWLFTADISSPYSIKLVVPLPVPVGLVCLGNLYLILSSVCFVFTANGVNLTDGLDGLAGGTAALAFIGMSIAVLPICSDLAVFGASMAGACVGFLFHNRYKASVLMGDTGSLALGGALAAMASCTGMFIPLLVSSGIFVLEALSVLIQVSYFKTTKYLHGSGRRLFRMVPFHHHLELCGLREPIIVAGAYVVSSMLMLYGGYVGLISV